MDDTRTSLLIRIRDQNDSLAWSEFYEVYSPLLYRYARARGLKHEDAEDVRARCFEAIADKIGDFEYDPTRGRFKAWLRTMVDRRVVDQFRRMREATLDTNELAQLPDSGGTAEELWETHWRQQHLLYCVEQARKVVAKQTYLVFKMLSDEVAVPEICEQLELTPNQVYKAKAKMLQAIRTIMRQYFPDEIGPAD